MATLAKIGYGASLIWNTYAVVELRKIGKVDLKTAKLDATTFGSANYCKEYLPGMIDPGEIAIEGWFRPDDTTGQKAMYDDLNSRTLRAFVVNFPTALSTTTWTGNAYLISFAPGDITPENIIPFTAILAITGKPTLSVTLSADLSDMTGIEQHTTSALVLTPAFDTDVYVYTTDVNTASTWIKLNVTQTTAISITATALGTTYTMTSTVDCQIAIDDADSVTEVVISEYDTGKAAKTYTIYVARPAA